MQDFTIGELAKKTGYAPQTLRYYEEIGLMPAPPRSEGRQRRYNEWHLQRLRFIRHARELGFDIGAIRTLLQLSELPERPCADADAIAREHLASIDRKIAHLTALRQEIARMIEQCTGEEISKCRVIEVLADHRHCLGEHG